MTNLALVVALLSFLVVSGNRERWGKIEPNYTFRTPANEYLDFWQFSGSAFVDNNQLRFAPESQKRSGHFWNKLPTRMTSWEVLIEFSVQGPAPLNTGEGMAFWHTTNPTVDGAVYGYSDRFSGLGIFFDSFDSNEDGTAEPYVLAMYNDGTKAIDEEDAGQQLGVCFVDYRNLPYPARAKISYTPDNGGHLTVGMDVSNSGKYRSCLSVKDVVLNPETQHFGLSVADYASDFTVTSFVGINTSERFEPVEAEENREEVVLPDWSESESESETVDGKHHASFSEHQHFEELTAKLTSIDSQLFNLEDEFSKKFASFFHTHNSHFQHHISNTLQNELNSKHTLSVQEIDRVSQGAGLLQKTVEELRDLYHGNAGGGAPPPDAVDMSSVVAGVKEACVEDTDRGQNLIAQLKDSVATLKTRQERVLQAVHTDLINIKSTIESTCGLGASTGSLVTCLAAGVVVGVVLGLVTKKEPRHKRW